MRRRARDFKGWRPVEQIEEGQTLLPLHGIAYRRWQDAGAITAFIPMNVIWAWARRFLIWMRFQAPGGMVWLDAKLRDAYNLGHREAHAKYAKPPR
jgi:hypothetical protein